MKKTKKQLRLAKETIRTLTTAELEYVGGGWIRPPMTWSCPQPSLSGCCPVETQ